MRRASSGLAYSAPTGSRMQSVVDAECFFNTKLSALMQDKGYDYEAKFIQKFGTVNEDVMNVTTANLPQSKFNYEMLNMILDELMLWHKTHMTFSLLEVKR